MSRGDLQLCVLSCPHFPGYFLPGKDEKSRDVAVTDMVYELFIITNWRELTKLCNKSARRSTWPPSGISKMSNQYEDVAFSPDPSRPKRRSAPLTPSLPSWPTPYMPRSPLSSVSTSVSGIYGMPRRTMVRLCVLVLVGLPSLVYLVGTASSQHTIGDAASSSNQRGNGQGWNRMPGDRRGEGDRGATGKGGVVSRMKFWEFGRGSGRTDQWSASATDGDSGGGTGVNGDEVIDLEAHLPLTTFDGGAFLLATSGR